MRWGDQGGWGKERGEREKESKGRGGRRDIGGSEGWEKEGGRQREGY